MYIYIFYLADHLSLTKLNNVLIEDVETLRAIGSICPNLQDVEFISTSLISESHSGEVETILKNWPKVFLKKIKTFYTWNITYFYFFLQVVAISIFEDVDSAYVKFILRALGPNLKRIEFQG